MPGYISPFRLKESLITHRFSRDENKTTPDILLSREWVVANGLGGYASRTLARVVTRKYHGMLVAALPAPFGRMVMLSGLNDELRLPDMTTAELGGEELPEGGLHLPGLEFLSEVRLEMGLPVWRFDVRGQIIEKRIVIPHQQNTVHVNYRLVSGGGPVRLRLHPYMHFRSLEAKDLVSSELKEPYSVKALGNRYEVKGPEEVPVLRLFLYGEEGSFNLSGGEFKDFFYRIEKARNYDCRRERLWSPGFFRVILPEEGSEATLVASTEPWDMILALKPDEALDAEIYRRKRLLARAHPAVRSGPVAELVLTADQFIVAPISRIGDVAWAHASGDEVRSIIAGYHWFTDWGRDTMISLPGLALAAGRFSEAGFILRTFAHYVQDGLIPNMFPEGKIKGLYNTADATLWFFHAIESYVEATGDRLTLQLLLPVLLDIVDHHIRGTKFNIKVDPSDGLLLQGVEGLPLTWMDAKLGEWVITPRRGKAVEINALWYNALRLLEKWLKEEEMENRAKEIGLLADRCFDSFNRRFWYEEGKYLYDIVDGENGDDTSLRPNQIFSISLSHPVLDTSRWDRVLEVVREHLLTPVGLRSLAPESPAFKSRYYGDLLARDTAYHQGTVWAWLIDPFIDAWIKIHPDDRSGARRFLEGLLANLEDGCIGSINEVFDAVSPFDPEGCISQAWSVAAVLSSWIKTSARQT